MKRLLSVWGWWVCGNSHFTTREPLRQFQLTVAHLRIEEDLSPRAKELREAWLKSLSDIIVSAEQRPKAHVNREAAQQTIQRILTTLGPDARYLTPPSTPPDAGQADKICSTMISLYDHILAQESSSLAANTIRWMFMDTSAATRK